MSDLYPIKLYVYRHDGKYDVNQVRTIPDEATLNSPHVRGEVRNAIRNRFEVRMTDPNDHLVFHSVNGVILFPPQEAK